MSSRIDIRIDQELPAIALEWKDRDGTVRNFLTGWTFTVKVATVAAPTTVILTKTAGITLDSASPNVIIEWSAADLSTISTALGTLPSYGTPCIVYVYARRDSDSKDDVFPRDVLVNFLPAPA